MTSPVTAEKDVLKALVRVLPAVVRHRIRKAYARYSIRREQPPPEFSIIRLLIRDCDVIVDAGGNP